MENKDQIKAVRNSEEFMQGQWGNFRLGKKEIEKCLLLNHWVGH